MSTRVERAGNREHYQAVLTQDGEGGLPGFSSGVGSPVLENHPLESPRNWVAAEHCRASREPVVVCAGRQLALRRGHVGPVLEDVGGVEGKEIYVYCAQLGELWVVDVPWEVMSVL